MLNNITRIYVLNFHAFYIARGCFLISYFHSFGGMNYGSYSHLNINENEKEYISVRVKIKLNNFHSDYSNCIRFTPLSIIIIVIYLIKKLMYYSACWWQ